MPALEIVCRETEVIETVSSDKVRMDPLVNFFLQIEKKPRFSIIKKYLQKSKAINQFS